MSYIRRFVTDAASPVTMDSIRDEVCWFDPETGDPRCRRPATQLIFWKDGRYSPSCGKHGFAHMDADVLSVYPILMIDVAPESA